MDKRFLNCGVLIAFVLCVIVLFAGIFSYSSYKKYSDDFHNLTSKQEYETNSVEYKATVSEVITSVDELSIFIMLEILCVSIFSFLTYVRVVVLPRECKSDKLLMEAK